MQRISTKEAQELLFSSDAKYVAQELSSVYYDNFSGRASLDTYMAHGCLVIKSGTAWHVHAICTESDISSAIEEAQGHMNIGNDTLMALTWSSIPKELEGKRGSYKFAREYQPYNDLAIRYLTIDDRGQVEKCCAYDAEDNPIGKNIANEFLTYYNDFINDTNAINLGLFVNNSLVGFVQSFEQKELQLSTVNIYVTRKHRKKGYAKRLLSAICATNKNTIYCYSCVKTNEASMNTAKACGFQFKGAYLFI